MSTHDIVVVGTSAGGVEALSRLVAGLPADLPAAVFVVLHVPPESPSALPQILSRAGPLPAVHPTDYEPIQHGRIYVAPPDLHLMLSDTHMRVVPGPKENRQRPAIDPLFRSAARACGPRVVGVVLTGALNDGTAGLLAIKRRGGLAIVQDPDDAFVRSMPESALANVPVDQCLPLARIAACLAKVVHELAPSDEEFPLSEELRMETDIAGLDPERGDREPRPGHLVGLICPTCRGPLWEIRDGKLRRYRCLVGHAFTAEALIADQDDAIEGALWMAVNTLEQSAQMSAKLASDSRASGRTRSAEHFGRQTRAANERAAILRNLLLEVPGSAVAPAETAEANHEATHKETEEPRDTPAPGEPVAP